MRTQQENLRELSRSDCLRLLRSVPFGRLVYTAQALPAVQPVNFTVLGDEAIFIRTASSSKLLAAASDSVVAFQADDIDEFTRAGWTVTVVGRCSEVVDPAELADLARNGPEAWGRPDSHRFIAIDISEVDGRWLHSPAVIIH